MGCPHQPGWYIQQLRQLRSRLDRANVTFISRAGLNTSHPHAVGVKTGIAGALVVLASTAAVAAALISLPLVAISQMWAESDAAGGDFHYACGVEAAHTIEDHIDALRHKSALDRGWDDVCDELDLFRKTVELLERAAAAR